MTQTNIQPEQHEFSLVQGGLLFQLWRRSRLSGPELENVNRRVVVSCTFLWLPLLILSLYEGHAYDGDIEVPFLYDIATYARYLIATPILVAAEVFVHQNLWPRLKMFLERKIVLDEELPGFQAASDSAMRLRNSITLEVVLLVLVYTLGLWFWRSQIASGEATWYATPDGINMNLTLAGYWFAFVSIPLAQFIVLRWYARYFILARFLWSVSRLNLRLIATHPDRAGGLGFLGKTTYAFASVLFAQGVLLSAFIASEVINNGRNIMDFRVDAVGFLIFFVCAALSPLAVFAPALLAAKRHGLRLYGTLSSQYVAEFEEKWIRKRDEGGEELLGTGDIQSLADLGNSYNVVREMNLFPFVWTDVLRLSAFAAAPLLPLALLIFSLEELIEKIFKVLIG